MLNEGKFYIEITQWYIVLSSNKWNRSVWRKSKILNHFTLILYLFFSSNVFNCSQKIILIKIIIIAILENSNSCVEKCYKNIFVYTLDYNKIVFICNFLSNSLVNIPGHDFYKYFYGN